MHYHTTSAADNDEQGMTVINNTDILVPITILSNSHDKDPLTTHSTHRTVVILVII